MVIVRLTGGIGNQMFQYAAARRAAFVNNASLKMDLGGFDDPGQGTKRSYELDAFLISGKTALPTEVAALKYYRQNPFIRRLPIFFKKRIFHYNKTHIIEKHYDFDPEILSLKGNVYLDGYWQSDKYFKDIETLLRTEFSFRYEPGGQNLHYTDLIQASESISLHVRRGDYVSSTKTNAFHGVCSIEYYREAINRIKTQISAPVFFVFSDDIEWAKSNLPLSHGAYFVDCNGTDHGYEDMRLMSLCKHHIIANSSFSWWGAWLSTNPGKIVFAPQRWFSATLETKDNIPELWVRI